MRTRRSARNQMILWKALGGVKAKKKRTRKVRGIKVPRFRSDPVGPIHEVEESFNLGDKVVFNLGKISGHQDEYGKVIKIDSDGWVHVDTKDGVMSFRSGAVGQRLSMLHHETPGSKKGRY